MEKDMERATSSATATGEAARGVAAPGFRMPGDMRLGRVRLQVTDLERSLAYYTGVLGMAVVSRTETDAALGVSAGDEPLVELHARAGATPVPRQGRLGLYHYAILLPDRAALGRFLAHLAELGVYAGMSDHMVSEAIYLRDPDGLGIEVYADRPRETWRYRGQEIEMATDPLDARAVVEAARGERWTGMPAGTRMGHVHLHVADLAQAADFYHRALGLDEVVWSYPGALFLSAGGYHHHLGLNTWAVGAPPAAENEARLLDWEIALPSDASDAAAASLAAAGHRVTALENGWSARDPWGTTVRVVARATD